MGGCRWALSSQAQGGKSVAVITYLDTTHTSACPPWLVGAQSIATAEGPHGRLWGAGDPWLLRCTMADPEMDGDWRCRWDGVPEQLRKHLWAEPVPVEDLQGRKWRAPKILTSSGERAFSVAYGRDWLPALTPAQERALAIAKAAKTAFDGADYPDQPTCCQWAAELLTVCHHIPVDAVGACAIMDDALVIKILAAATATDIEFKD
jgi:hypothetical protein